MQLFDKDKLLMNFDGDEELAQSILEEALIEIPKDLEKLRAACKNDNSETVRVSAHTIKGMAANLCTPALCDICMKIEAAGRDGDVESARGFLAELENTAQQTVEAISGNYRMRAAQA